MMKRLLLTICTFFVLLNCTLGQGTTWLDQPFRYRFGMTKVNDMAVLSRRSVLTMPFNNIDSVGAIFYYNIDDRFYGRTTTGVFPFAFSGDFINYYTKTESDARYPLLSGAYSNPDWITALAWSKLIGTPNTLAGYGITDGVNNTRSILTTSPLQGGGNLTADRTLSILNAAADGMTKGAASFTANDFDATAGNISLDYTNGQVASGSTKGFLTAANWTTFNNKMGSLNGLAAVTQTFVTGTAGTDFNISSATSTHTFNLPDASGTTRGVITTGAQTIAGIKTLSSNLVLSTVPALGTAATTFLTTNSGTVSSRTVSQVLSDIGGAPASGSGNYIQNQIAAAQATSNGWVSGSLFASASNGFRLVNDGGFLAGYNTANTTRSGYLQFNNAGPSILATDISQPLAFYTAGAEKMRLTTDGELGLGVTDGFSSIHTKLSNAGLTATATGAYGAASGGSVWLFNSGTPTAANQKIGTFAMGSAPTDPNPRPAVLIEGYTEGAWTDNVSHPSYLRFSTTASGFNSTSERVRITSDGSTGIGTSAPFSILHASSSSITGVTVQNTSAFATNSGGFTRLINNGTPSASGHRLGGILFGSNPSGSIVRQGAIIQATANTAWADGSSHPTDISFWTCPGLSINPLQRMTLDQAGNLGIGNTSPGNLLYVSKLSNVTPGTASTYAFQTLQGASSVAIGGDANYAYLQSFTSKPLLINSQGNNVGINVLGTPASTLEVNGTITSPWLTAPANEDLLLQAPAGQRLVAAIGATTAVAVNSDASVDIGTVSTPFGTVKLNVGGNVQCNDAFILSDGSTNAEFGIIGPGAFIRTVSNHPLQFRTNDVIRATINATGEVGINTVATSGMTLDVNGPSRFTSVITAITSTATSLTLTQAHHTVRITASGIVITIPAASGHTGRIFVLVNTSAGSVTTSSYLNLSGAGTTTLAANTSLWIQSDGTNWLQIK